MMGEHILYYRIDKLIGEGLTGSVFRAVDVTTNLPVLIRQIHPYLVHSTPIKQNLAQQIDTLASLQHPGIGNIYTYTEQSDQLYIVSEYTEDTTLSAYIHSSKEPISEEKVWDIVTQMLDIFSYAHNKGIFHHSISPDCIVINEAGKVKILGFGIAGLFTDPASGLPAPDIRLGNIQYQSPEQVYGKPPDARSDIYSIGVVLYELLTRQLPYPSVLSAFEIQTKISKDALPLIKLYTTAFSKSYRMQDIIDKATAKNPDYRYPHCEAFYEALQEEKDERESVLISEMMQHIAGKTIGTAHLHENSTIELVKKRTHLNTLTYVFLGVVFLATAMVFTSTFRNLAIEAERKTTPEAEDSPKPEPSPPVKNRNLADEANETKKKQAENNLPVSKKDALSATETDTLLEQADENDNDAIASAGVEMVSKSNKIYTATDLQIRLKHFYEALRSKDISQVEGYYAPTLTRFFNEYAVEEDLLNELIERSWERTPEDDHEIIWDTFRYYRDEKGNYIMDFYMNYHYRREERQTWKKRKMYTMIKMDKNLRIYYMDGE